MLSRTQRILVAGASLFYVLAGTLHFLKTGTYVKIMPPSVPRPIAMVYISGVAEVTGAIGLLIPRLRRTAAWGLVALLVAVFPANVYMASANVQVTATPISRAWLWARLPLQAFLIWWVLWCTKLRADNNRG